MSGPGLGALSKNRWLGGKVFPFQLLRSIIADKFDLINWAFVTLNVLSGVSHIVF